MKPIQKIVVLGPESTGKSTLCAALAAHYQTIWTPEYARAYLSEHGTKYTYDDLLTIAKGQIKNEDEAYASLNKNIVDHFDIKLGFSFWLMSSIVEKNPWKTEGIYEVLKIIAIKKYITDFCSDDFNSQSNIFIYPFWWTAQNSNLESPGS